MAGLKRAGVPVCCLILAAALVFGRAVTAQFVQWDDPDLVVENPQLNPPTVANTLEFWKRPYIGLYTPLAYTAWSRIAAMEGKAPGQLLSAGPFHFWNLLLHVAAAIFAFLLFRELVSGVWAAWAGAMVFLLHPLQVEPVAWVSGMNNLLCGMFCLAALWQYVIYTKQRPGGLKHFVLATVIFCAALLSKPSAVVLPLIAAALEICVLRKPRIFWRWKNFTSAWPAAVWGAIAVPFAIAARLVQPSVAIQPPPWWGRLLVADDALGFYLVKLIAPLGLRIDYERTPQWLMDHPWAAWPGLAVLLPAAMAIFGRRTAWLRGPLLILPLGLLPVLGLTPFDFQGYSTVADRYMYIPMLGVALFAALLMDKAKGHLIPWTLAAIVLALMAARSGDQMRVWRNTETLAGQQLAQDPGSPTGHKILAAWLSTQHRDSEAEREFKAAIAALDQQPAPDGATWFDYGNLLLRQGRYEEAIAEYEIAIPRLTIPKRVLALNNLGIAFYRTGDAAEARRQFESALHLRPDDRQAKENLEMLNGD